MKLSEHFSLAEFIRSDTATRHNHAQKPSAAHIENMRELCQSVLEPLRKTVDSPVRVNSGYRDDFTNRMVGGSPRSSHLSGRAADIVVHGVSARGLAIAIEGTNIQFDKMILEFDSWIHIQIAKEGEKNRQLIYTARHIPVNSGRKVEYVRGLV